MWVRPTCRAGLTGFGGPMAVAAPAAATASTTVGSSTIEA